jgi:hypothetical protein
MWSGLVVGLSAEHGLLAPSTVLAPYDLRRSKTSRRYHYEWGQRVLMQLRERRDSAQKPMKSEPQRSCSRNCRYKRAIWRLRMDLFVA